MPVARLTAQMRRHVPTRAPDPDLPLPTARHKAMLSTRKSALLSKFLLALAALETAQQSARPSLR
eukprot:4621109-Karenia_brevis.AAC.1